MERIVSRLPNELVTSVGKIIVLAEGEDAAFLVTEFFVIALPMLTTSARADGDRKSVV